MKRTLFTLIIGIAFSIPMAFANDDLRVEPEVLVSEMVYDELEGNVPSGGEINVRFMSPLPVDIMGIHRFVYDSRNGRFRADFMTEGGLVEPAVGMAVIEVEIPVPSHRVDAGTILEQTDIVMDRIPAFQVNNMAVTDYDTLIGMQAKRALVPGRPIQEHAIGEPIVAERGNNVTIIVKDGPISVTAPGRLLENGAQGQRVRVINDISNRTVDAHVVNSETVEVKF